MEQILNELQQMNERFQQMENRMDQRFQQMENRMDQKFQQMDSKIQHLEEKMDVRFEKVAEQLDRMETTLNAVAETSNDDTIAILARIEKNTKNMN